RPEQRKCPSGRISYAGISNAVAAVAPRRLSEYLALCPIVGVEQRRIRPIHGTSQLTVIRVTRRFVGRPHEPLEVIRGFGQSDLEPIPTIPNPISTIRKSTGPVRRSMGERGHHQRSG